MANIIKIVGIGPGDGRYITPLAREAIESAEVLVGGRRQLDILARPGQECFAITSNLAALVEYIEFKRRTRRVAVLASGDPGLFSIGTYLTRHLDSESMEFIPGVSSLQVMFARLKRSWHDARIYSFHGRCPDHIQDIISEKQLIAILTGGDWSPQKLASLFIDMGCPDRVVAIGQNLSYPEERLVFSSLSQLAGDADEYENSIMVVFNE